MTALPGRASLPPTELTYRADIDGLRAIAVLVVVAFHYGVPGFSGGFVGVDVFFVISGYLITQLLQRALERGNYSLRHFYERRIRRIFPALFVVLAATAGLGYLVLLPGELADLGRSVLATLGFASNFLFWSQTGYFDGPAHFKPLLHTWSLAVEEQFYIVFPPLMYVLFRHARRALPAVLAVLGIVSFALSALQVNEAREAAFFLPFGRAWELIVGAWLVVSPWRQAELPRARAAAGWLGLAAIIVTVLIYDSRTDFPGHGALLPVLGTAGLIWSGERGGAMARLLSLRPLVAIGLISYSLYLWHWPLIVLAGLYTILPLTGLQTALVLALALGLSFASWRYVELPFRRGKGGAGRVFAGAAAAACGVAAVGAVFVATHGAPWRLTSEVNALAAAADTVRETECFQGSGPDLETACRLGGEGAPGFVLWGDSHARALVPGFDALARRAGVSGLAFGRGGCPPFLEPGSRTKAWCHPLAVEAIRFLAGEPGIHTVVIAARWDLYADGAFAPADGPRAISGGDAEAADEGVGQGAGEGPGEGPGTTPFARELARTVERLTRSGKRVILMGPVPTVDYDVPRTLAAARLMRRDLDLRPPLEAFLSREAPVLQVLRGLARDERVTLFLPHEILCADGACAVIAGDTPLYFDDDHLSPTGARLVVDGLSDELLPGLSGASARTD